VRLKINLALIFIILFGGIVFIGTIFLLDNFSISQMEPRFFVKNRTVLTSSDIFYDYKIIKYPSKVEIIDLKPGELVDLVGISTESWIFNFGIVPVGDNYVKKTMVLNGTDYQEVMVNLIVFGNISEMVSFSKNNFPLEGDEIVFVFLNVTEDIKPGNYTGEIDVIMKKEK
jgi:hypothetical protein